MQKYYPSNYILNKNIKNNYIGHYVQQKGICHVNNQHVYFCLQNNL